MTPAGLAFDARGERSEDAAAVVDAGLETHNRSAAPLDDVRPLDCYVRNAEGAVVGGAVGRSWGQCAEILQLWVAPELRGNGIGTELVALFEARARDRGCRTVYLTTLSFQAPELYRRLGYAVATEIRGYPEGIVKYLMIRGLDGQ